MQCGAPLFLVNLLHEGELIHSSQETEYLIICSSSIAMTFISTITLQSQIVETSISHISPSMRSHSCKHKTSDHWIQLTFNQECPSQPGLVSDPFSLSSHQSHGI